MTWETSKSVHKSAIINGATKPLLQLSNGWCGWCCTWASCRSPTAIHGWFSKDCLYGLYMTLKILCVYVVHMFYLVQPSFVAIFPDHILNPSHSRGFLNGGTPEITLTRIFHEININTHSILGKWGPKSSIFHTVDGRNPAPVDRWFIP